MLNNVFKLTFNFIMELEKEQIVNEVWLYGSVAMVLITKHCVILHSLTNNSLGALPFFNKPKIVHNKHVLPWKPPTKDILLDVTFIMLFFLLLEVRHKGKISMSVTMVNVIAPGGLKINY